MGIITQRIDYITSSAKKNNNANVQGQKIAYKNLTVKLNNKLKPEEELKQKVRAKARP